MRRFRIPIGTPELIFAGVVLIAFVTGGLLLGRPVELLVTCGGFVDCTGMRDRYIDLDFGAGLATALVTAVLIVLAGVLRGWRSR